MSVRLQEEKASASQEERDYREGLCDVGDCVYLTCGYECSACTKCRETAAAFQRLVNNEQGCTENCDSVIVKEAVDDSLAQDQTTYSSITSAMENCMATVTNKAEREACVGDSARAELEVSLGIVVDDITLYDYLHDAAADALADKMSSCTATATTQDDLDNCLEQDGKSLLAGSLGLDLEDVTSEMVFVYVEEGALETAASAVDSCMDVATSAAERLFCVTGDDLKSTLAASLGMLVGNVDTGDLQEYVDKAAVERTIDVIDACVNQIDSSISSGQVTTARKNCRENVGCDSLATYLGLLSTELTKAECFKQLGSVSEKQVGDKMAACIAAIDTSDGQQATKRNQCKTVTALAALATVNGIDAEDISTAQLEVYVQDAAITQVQAAMSSCMKAINTTSDSATKAAAMGLCRTNPAKAALAQTLGVLESELDAETIQEHLDSAAENTVRTAIKACRRLSGTEKSTCVTNAQAKAATTLGVTSISYLDFAKMQDSAGVNEVLAAAKACAESNSTCDFKDSYNSASGDSSNLTSLATARATANIANARAGAKELIKQNLAACKSSTNTAGQTRNATEIAACSQSVSTSAFGLMEKPSRMNQVIRAATRELAADRMQSCMQQVNQTSSSCIAKAKARMQEYSTSVVSDKDVMDSLLVERISYYSQVFGSQEGIGCASSDLSICLSQAASKSSDFGGSPKAMRIELAFNAVRKAAATWASCEDSQSVGAADCEVQAKYEFEQLGGNPAEWTSTERDHARDIATGSYIGSLTEIIRKDYTVLVFTVASACSSIATVTFSADVETQVKNIDSGLVMSAVAEPWDVSASECQMKYRISLGSSSLTTVNVATSAESISVTAQLARRSIFPGSDRRTISSTTNAAQAVIECLNSCTIAPTNAPTTTFAPTMSSSSSDQLWWILMLSLVTGCCMVGIIGMLIWKTSHAEQNRPSADHQMQVTSEPGAIGTRDTILDVQEGQVGVALNEQV